MYLRGKRMKILMALAGLDIGGAETHVVELSKEMVRRGHEVVMISGGGVYREDVEDYGIKHYTVPVKERNYIKIIRAYKMIKKIILKEKPDLVHSHARIPSFIIGLIHKKLNESFVYVTTVHGAFDTSYLVRSLTCWGEKTLAVSEDLKSYLVKYYNVSPKNVFLSINGIDTGTFNPDVPKERIIEEFSLNPDAKRIVYVSRLEDDVALPAYMILKKMPEILKACPDLEFVIVGDGNVYTDIKEKADKINKKAGRKAVILTGQRTDVNEIHAAADVCVGVSRAVLEPMAMAKPCIVAGQEGYIGILTKDNLKQAMDSNFTCRNCASLDGDVLFKDILHLLCMSEEEINKLALFAQNIVDTNYSIDKMAEDNLQMYEEAIKSHGNNAVMVGYYGYGNCGDDALLEAILFELKDKLKVFSPVVLSKNPNETREIYGVKSINRFNLPKVIKALKNAKVFIAGGGSLIQDVTSTRSLLYYLFCLKAAKHYGLKTMLYGNGIGPVNKKKNRLKAARVLDSVDIITLRDQDSQRYLKELGVTKPRVYVTGDPALALTNCNTASADKILLGHGVYGRFFAVSVRNIKADTLAFAEHFAHMADYIAEKYSLIPVFVPMQRSKDKKISELIISKMANKAYFIDGDTDVSTIMGIISRCEVIIAVRLHMLLFGASLGVPVFGINYDPKVKSNILGLGLGKCIEPEEILNGSYRQAIDEFMSNRDELRKSALEKAVIHRDKAKQNADIARTLMEEED
jgi:polysaccharide pyruvyl transferase CsaB